MKTYQIDRRYKCKPLALYIYIYHNLQMYMYICNQEIYTDVKNSRNEYIN